MLKGFIDHWAPSRDDISKFWKTDLNIVQKKIAELKQEIRFNNFTFYTKWFTNGIYSSLPFLYNNQESANVKTKNQWGRLLIDYFHDQGISVGNMLQLLFYEKESWGNDYILGSTEDCKKYAATAQSEIIADFTQPEYMGRVKKLIEEQITEFPDFDFLFLEFEGVRPEDFTKIYEKWAISNGMPDAANLTFSSDTRRYCESISEELDIMWSDEGREMFRYYYGRNLKQILDLLQIMKYQGTVGIVHHLYGYEAFVYPDILPDKDWWLLPWHYWVFEKPGILDTELQMKKGLSKSLLEKWKSAGHKVCYIGDVALGKNGLSHIDEFYKYCLDIHLEGYLGMGNPDPDIGLRWNEGEQIGESDILAARNLYKNLY